MLVLALPLLSTAVPMVTREDSVPATFVNRVRIEINAPAATVWRYLPGLRPRPGMEKVSLNGLENQFGARFDTIYRDSTGKVTRHDRIEVLHWEPGVRYVALVRYLPPSPPITIVYNVDLKEEGGVTRFVMDSYSTLTTSAAGTEAERVERLATQRRQFQDAVETGYRAFKTDVEAAVRNPGGKDGGR